MANLENTQVGLLLFTYLIVPVLCQTQTQCYYYIADNSQPNSGFSNFKNCFYGCCSNTNIDPCCQTPDQGVSLGPGAIGGIVIGVIVALIIFGAVIFFCFFRKKDDPGEKYITPAKPTVSYITQSEPTATSVITDATDLSRLPPVAKFDDEEMDMKSSRSYKSDSYSQQSEPRYNNRDRSNGRPTHSMTSIDSTERAPRHDEYRPHTRPTLSSSSIGSTERTPRNDEYRPHTRPTHSTSSIDSRDSHSRHDFPRHHHRPNMNTSSVSREDHHHHGQSRSRQHSRNVANSISSMNSRDNYNRHERQSETSNTDSIGTTV